MGGRRSPDPTAEAELASLLVPEPTLGAPMPAYAGRSLPNVMSSVIRALGAELSGPWPIVRPLEPGLDPFNGRRAEGPVVVLLVDAFGWRGLSDWSSAEREPLAAQWKERAHPITTVFPSATASALPSLSTATPPGRHGMIGYRQYLPSYGLVADLIKMMPLGVTSPESLVGPHWSPDLVSGVPNVFARGLAATVVVPSSFVGTGFTRLLYEGAEFVPYATLTDLAENVRHLLARPSPPALVMVYWDELDTIQHIWGPRPELARLELGQVARAIGHVGDGLDAAARRRTTLLITGDHGQVSLTPEAEVALDREPAILQHLARAPAGDRRVGLLTARPGEAASLTEALRARLPPGSRILSAEVARNAGLFGPPPYHPELMDRLGDLVVLVPSPTGLTYLPPGAKPSQRHRAGGHGGLEPDELVVPLISGRLSDLV